VVVASPSATASTRGSSSPRWPQTRQCVAMVWLPAIPSAALGRCSFAARSEPPCPAPAGPWLLKPAAGTARGGPVFCLLWPAPRRPPWPCRGAGRPGGSPPQFGPSSAAMPFPAPGYRKGALPARKRRYRPFPGGKPRRGPPRAGQGPSRGPALSQPTFLRRSPLSGPRAGFGGQCAGKARQLAGWSAAEHFPMVSP
jgi:hypothetical protein